MIIPFHFDWLRLNDRIEAPNTESPVSAKNISIKKNFFFHSLGGLFAAKFLKWLPFITSADSLPVVAL